MRLHEFGRIARASQLALRLARANVMGASTAAAVLAADPFDEIEHQGVRCLGHRRLRIRSRRIQNASALLRVNNSQPP
jgi:hypothetical protein